MIIAFFCSIKSDTNSNENLKEIGYTLMEEKTIMGVKIKCELCNSTSFKKENGFYVCENCGTKYSLDEAKKLLERNEDYSEQNDEVAKEKTSSNSDVSLARIIAKSILAQLYFNHFLFYRIDYYELSNTPNYLMTHEKKEKLVLYEKAKTLFENYAKEAGLLLDKKHFDNGSRYDIDDYTDYGVIFFTSFFSLDKKHKYIEEVEIDGEIYIRLTDIFLSLLDELNAYLRMVGITPKFTLNGYYYGDPYFDKELKIKKTLIDSEFFDEEDGYVPVNYSFQTSTLHYNDDMRCRIETFFETYFPEPCFVTAKSVGFDVWNDCESNLLKISKEDKKAHLEFGDYKANLGLDDSNDETIPVAENEATSKSTTENKGDDSVKSVTKKDHPQTYEEKWISIYEKRLKNLRIILFIIAPLFAACSLTDVVLFYVFSQGIFSFNFLLLAGLFGIISIASCVLGLIYIKRKHVISAPLIFIGGVFCVVASCLIFAELQIYIIQIISTILLILSFLPNLLFIVNTVKLKNMQKKI